LDDIAQAAFQGYESLNRVQSRIFQATYNTNENILVRNQIQYMCSCTMFKKHRCVIANLHNVQVCAPTGAGKTNIAMIAVLHEVYLGKPGKLF
jgi:activating signal cointegrator complex subunit 3